MLERVVAEESQMAGTAAGGHAGQHRGGYPAGAHTGQGVKVGNVGGFKFGLAGIRVGQAAQAVGNQQNYLGRCGGVTISQFFNVDHSLSSAIWAP